MNPQKTPELTVQTLMALRKETDAVRVITERLQVKEMGPADHIRTKHEVKAFVQSGDGTTADTLLKRAAERRSTKQTISMKASQQNRQNMAD